MLIDESCISESFCIFLHRDHPITLSKFDSVLYLTDISLHDEILDPRVHIHELTNRDPSCLILSRYESL